MNGKFSDNLRRVMKEKKFTVKGLARESGIPAKTIWALRAGQNRPMAYTLRILADTLGVTMDELFGRG